MEEASKEKLQFLLLKSLAIKANSGVSLDELIQEALERSLQIVNLPSGSILLFDGSEKEIFRVVCGRPEEKEILEKFLKDMILVLRKDFGMEVLFMSLDKNNVKSLFSYPVKIGQVFLGAISAISFTERNLAQETEFLEALSSQLSLVLSKYSLGKEISEAQLLRLQKEKLKAERLQAILETVTTVNHEINNPLAVILGNAELLLMKKKDLTPELEAKLKIIVESALRIKKVTTELLKLVEPIIVEYPSGIKMIDIEKSKLKDEETWAQVCWKAFTYRLQELISTKRVLNHILL